MNKFSYSIKVNTRSLRFGGIILLAGMLSYVSINAQTVTDSLDLSQVIQQVVSTHPSVQAASEALNAADVRIAMSKAYLLPLLDASATYFRQGPVPSLDFPINGEMKKFQLFPADNYSVELNVKYNLYDFGRGAAGTAVENENKIISGLSLDQLKQKLALGTANVYFSILFLQEAIRIKEDQLHLLKEHLAFVEKKKETGSATDYEVLSTKVNITNAESQEMDLVTAWKIQQGMLNTLMGDSSQLTHPVKYQLDVGSPEMSIDSLLTMALNNREEMRIAREKNIQAQLQYKLIEKQRLPMVNLFGNAGAKNGYIPNLNQLKPNFVAGISLSVPIFDARQTKNRLNLAQSSMKSLSYEESGVERNIRNELSESFNNLESARKKVDLNRMLLEQATQAYQLAEVNYKAGTITNLDLIDAQNKIAQSQLMLMKSQIDLEFGIYKLKSSLGEQLY